MSSILTVYSVYTRGGYAPGAIPVNAFGSIPNFQSSSRLEAMDFAKERALATNLPIIEHPFVDPDLRHGRDFESPGIYIVTDLYDELDPHELRCFRR
jgi:hypothetical protein